MISTDEPGALVEVDGKAGGFTPAILTLPVGLHRVALKLRGFRPERRTIAVLANGETHLDLVLTESEEVVPPRVPSSRSPMRRAP